MSNIEVKGFRKGKVPAEIAEKQISEQDILRKALDNYLDANYNTYIVEMQKEKIASKPELVVDSISKDEVSFKFKAALYPDVKLGDLSKLTTKFVESKISDDELKRELDSLKQFTTTTKEIKEPRALKNDDTANFDFLGKVDGVPFDGGKAEGHEMIIGSKQFIEGFEEQMVGMKKGEVKDIEVTFPKEYQAKNLAGKKSIFTVTLNSIKELVELKGEELIAKIKPMGFSSLENMKETVKTVLEERKEQESRDKFFNAVADEIHALEGTQLDIPAELIVDEVNDELKKFEEQVTKQGMDLKSYLKMLNKTAEEFKNEMLAPKATSKIAQGFVFQALVDHFKTEVNDEDFKMEFEKIAKLQDMTIEEIEKQVNKDNVKNALLYNKVISQLVKEIK
ncbi:MAG: trigger factor [Tenericutes bacterium]|nr:MAG: trigger factor [Mycoplasmatota bacterium]